MYTEARRIFRLPTLENNTDLIKWTRCIYAYIRRDETKLTYLHDKTVRASENKMGDWEEKPSKAKWNFVLCLDDAVLAKTRTIVENDKKDRQLPLWKELKKISTTSSGQDINNLHNRLNRLVLNGFKYPWDKNNLRFVYILDDLHVFDGDLTEKEKHSKIIRSLPKNVWSLGKW